MNRFDQRHRTIVRFKGNDQHRNGRVGALRRALYPVLLLPLALAAASAQNGVSLRILGNYPNPFQRETFLAYEITGSEPIDRIELKIYSTSGKLVRTLAYPSADPREAEGFQRGGTGTPTANGYHEAWWDGRDRFGTEAANGVYFYVLRVELGDESIEQTGSMARAR